MRAIRLPRFLAWRTTVVGVSARKRVTLRLGFCQPDAACARHFMRSGWPTQAMTVCVSGPPCRHDREVACCVPAGHRCRERLIPQRPIPPHTFSDLHTVGHLPRSPCPPAARPTARSGPITRSAAGRDPDRRWVCVTSTSGGGSHRCWRNARCYTGSQAEARVCDRGWQGSTRSASGRQVGRAQRRR